MLSRVARLFPLLLLLLAASGCANMTSSRHLVQPFTHPLPDCQTGELANELTHELGLRRNYDFAEAINNVEQRLTEQTIANGNHVELLIDGPESHRQQLAAIAKAQHHIHLEMYIITNEAIGKAYADALTERANAGVRVRVLFDSLGAMDAQWRFLPKLRKVGIATREFNAINPLKDARLWRANRRSHRKMLIVDGAVAFTGGVNISDDYTTDSSEQGWRDTHIKITGPAVRQFQQSFFDNWNAINPDIFPVIDTVVNVLDPLIPEFHTLDANPQYFPALAQRGEDKVRLISTKGASFIDLFTGIGKDVLKALSQNDRDEHYAIYKSYLAAILLAKESIWITQAYFAPNQEFLNALQEAALRGVDVRVLVPGKSDVSLMLNASRNFYQELLDAGIKIYEYDANMMHAKTAVIDGQWATVGSSNLDYRSFLHNDEANAVILGKAFGQQMRNMFTHDLKQAKPVNAETWADRPDSQKLKEAAAAALKYWI